MFRRTIIVCTVVLAMATFGAAEKKPFTVHDLVAMERVADPQPSRHLFGREAVSDRNHVAAGSDRSKIGDHALEIHRHIEGNGVTRGKAQIDKTVGHPVGKRFELTVGYGLNLVGAFAPHRDRDRAVRRLEAAVDDVELCPTKPHRLRGPFGEIEGGADRRGRSRGVSACFQCDR